MSKKIEMDIRPKAVPGMDKWVTQRVAPASTVKPKRLTVSIDPTLHRELKISCAQRGIQIADLVRDLISRDLEEHAPEEFPAH